MYYLRRQPLYELEDIGESDFVEDPFEVIVQSFDEHLASLCLCVFEHPEEDTQSARRDVLEQCAVENDIMPGTIVDVPVKAGQAVKAGDVLVVLEAMKMENEIKAPKDGTVTAVNVTKGESVNTGTCLVNLG